MSIKVFTDKPKPVVKGLIFDMDGVLFDTERDSLPLIQQIGKEMGMDIDLPFIIEHMGFNQTDLNVVYTEKFGSLFNPEKFWSTYWYRRNTKYDTYGQPVKEGALKLLALAKERNLPCVVSSSSLRTMVWRALERSKVKEYFVDVVGGDMIQHSKPNPEIFEIGAKLINCPVENCVVIEDSLNGLKAARAGRMIPCFVKDIPDYSQDLLRLYADYSFTSAEEIAQLF